MNVCYYIWLVFCEEGKSYNLWRFPKSQRKGKKNIKINSIKQMRDFFDKKEE